MHCKDTLRVEPEPELRLVQSLSRNQGAGAPAGNSGETWGEEYFPN